MKMYSNFDNTCQVKSVHVCADKGLTRMKSSTCMEGGRLVFCFLERNRFDRPDLIRISMATKHNTTYIIVNNSDGHSKLHLNKKTNLTFLEPLLSLWSSEGDLLALEGWCSWRRREEVLFELLLKVEVGTALTGQLGEVRRHLCVCVCGVGWGLVQKLPTFLRS